jgi:hypothetical protein
LPDPFFCLQIREKALRIFCGGDSALGWAAQLDPVGVADEPVIPLPGSHAVTHRVEEVADCFYFSLLFHFYCPKSSLP